MKSPTVIFEKEEIKTIKSGFGHTLVLTKQGNLYAAGVNTLGQLSMPNTEFEKKEFTLIFKDNQIRDVFAGGNFSVI